MMCCRIRAVAALLLAGVLAACAMPRPFAHDAPGTERLARLRTGGGVAVLPPAGAPAPFVTAAPAGLAEALRDMEVPAEAVAEVGARDYRIVSDFAFVAPPAPDKVAARVDWRVLGPEGQSLAARRQQVVLPFASWQDAAALRSIGAEVAADLARALEADMETPLADVHAAPAPRPLPGESAPPAGVDPGQAKVADATAPRVAVRVGGLDPERTDALRDAMEAALKRRGLRVGAEETADVVVAGSFARGDAQKADGDVVVPVRITWAVLGPDGSERGSASQQNAVPAEALSRRFTTLAVMIAQAAADGVVAVVQGRGTE